PSSGGNEETLIRLESFRQLDDVSPDGKYAVGSVVNGPTNRDVLLVFLDGSGKSQPFAATVANETQGQISPDGKLIAYTSDENGKLEVFVQSFPSPGDKRVVSADGGLQPRWRRDGKELFYLALDEALMSVPILGTSPLAFGAPVALFKTPAMNR